MSKRITISTQNRRNWLIDAAVFLGGILAALSGIYFLFLPSGGFQGGRNPMYGVTILFSRHAWEDVHTWGGVLMMAAILVHFAVHWKWVKMMGSRAKNSLMNREGKMSGFVKFNVAINTLIGVSFMVCALSGVYFLFAPSGGFQGGSNAGWDPNFLLSRTTWDLIHTWSGVVMIVAAVVHFWIHWRWVKNVTRKLFLSLLPQPGSDRVPVTN
jgi:drug/metabolite transporter (DMT)-like permease